MRRIIGARTLNLNKRILYSPLPLLLPRPAAQRLRYSTSTLPQHSSHATAGLKPSSFRALFRALLRQATYLPDPAARLFVKQRIVARFRAYNPRSNPAKHIVTASAVQNQVQKPTSLGRQLSLWRTGIRSFHRLQRANRGYRHDLLDVLLCTYGRKGFRRHELLRPLKLSGQGRLGDDSTEIVSKALSELPSFPHRVAATLPRLGPKLEALLKSQQEANLALSTRPKLRNIVLEIPKRNTWLRSTPVKRVANIIRRWYGHKLNQALSPLPHAEWSRVRDFARGQRKWEKPAIPRSRCWGVASTLSALDEALGLKKIENTGGKHQPHTLTKRYTRRLYSQVFHLCPEMSSSSTKTSWVFRWGSNQQRPPLLNTALK